MTQLIQSRIKLVCQGHDFLFELPRYISLKMNLNPPVWGVSSSLGGQFHYKIISTNDSNKKSFDQTTYFDPSVHQNKASRQRENV